MYGVSGKRGEIPEAVRSVCCKILFFLFRIRSFFHPSVMQAVFAVTGFQCLPILGTINCMAGARFFVDAAATSDANIMHKDLRLRIKDFAYQSMNVFLIWILNQACPVP